MPCEGDEYALNGSHTADYILNHTSPLDYSVEIDTSGNEPCIKMIRPAQGWNIVGSQLTSPDSSLERVKARIIHLYGYYTEFIWHNFAAATDCESRQMHKYALLPADYQSPLPDHLWTAIGLAKPPMPQRLLCNSRFHWVNDLEDMRDLERCLNNQIGEAFTWMAYAALVLRFSPAAKICGFDPSYLDLVHSPRYILTLSYNPILRGPIFTGILYQGHYPATDFNNIWQLNSRDYVHDIINDARVLTGGNAIPPFGNRRVDPKPSRRLTNKEWELLMKAKEASRSGNWIDESITPEASAALLKGFDDLDLLIDSAKSILKTDFPGIVFTDGLRHNNSPTDPIIPYFNYDAVSENEEIDMLASETTTEELGTLDEIIEAWHNMDDELD